MGPLDEQVLRTDALSATADGLDIAVHMHWYRALPLSCLTLLEVTVDEIAVANDELAVAVNGQWYRFDELAERTDEYWFTTDPVVVHTPVASHPGRRHRVRVALGLSIPYILTGPARVPLLATCNATKTLTTA